MRRNGRRVWLRLRSARSRWQRERVAAAGRARQIAGDANCQGDLAIRRPRSLLALLGALSVSPTPARAQETLRIVAYNIRHGAGMDERVDLERVADALRGLDADVITLQEVDDRTERTDGVDQVGALAELLGYEGFHGPHRPYQGGFYGNATLTRLPIVAQRTHPIPPASGSALAVHETVVRIASAPGGTVSVVSVHLAGSPAERRAQADSVTSYFRDLDHPVILAGDFNGRPDDAAVVRLGLDWTIAAKSGDPRTYPADAPDREIDFVMWRSPVRDAGAGGGDGLEVVEHRVVPEPMASDHRPVLAVFRLSTPELRSPSDTP